MIRGNATNLRPDQVEATLNIMKFIAFSSCLQFFVTVGASWANRHVLPELVNHQAQLDSTLEAGAHPTHRWKSLSREQLERSLMLALAIMVALAPAALLGINAQADYLAELFVHSVVLGYLGFSAVLSEYVIVLNFRKLRQLFEQVRRSMRVWSERNRKVVSDDVVDGWCDTLLEIRRQGYLLSRYLAPTMLPALLLAMILCTLCLFSSLNVMQGRVEYQENNDKLSALAGYLSCAFLSVVTLYCNAKLAQKITNKVLLLGIGNFGLN